MITAASIGFGLLASLGLLVNGMPRRSFLKAWPVTSALIFTALLSLTAVLRFVPIRPS
ncbi:MAG TPA: hypothetical protein VN324_10735 [Quisquiliibacterium sp.]|nr:hypothetical protein [Quisquiliibacterium sp.]